MEKIYNNTLVSIIMPAYNAEKYIAESIDSVLNQHYSSWELLIIDDCSKDATSQIIKRYSIRDNRIKSIVLPYNVGVAGARNAGIDKAKGRYLAFLDSDDLWLPQKLAVQIEFMQKNNIAFSYTQYRQFNGEKKNSGSIIKVEKMVEYRALLKGNTIGCLTVVIDRKYISEFRMPLCRHEDYVTWLNILKQGYVAYGLNEDLARYRKSISSLSGNKFKSIWWTWMVYTKTQNLSKNNALKYLLFYIVKGIKKYFKV